MGTAISVRNFSENNVSGLLKPIIYCCPYKDVESRAVSINLLLAEKLKAYRQNRRTMRIESLFNQILAELPDDVVIKDFDVMFNPVYKIDVLKILITACKSKKFSVIWPGRFEEGKLLYAEEGYEDYKTFSVENYDVTCIIQGGRKI